MNWVKSLQAPVQHPSRYQSRYIITPDTTVIQGMDGVVMGKRTNSNNTQGTTSNTNSTNGKNENSSPEPYGIPVTISDSSNTKEKEKKSSKSYGTPATINSSNSTQIPKLQHKKTK